MARNTIGQMIDKGAITAEEVKPHYPAVFALMRAVYRENKRRGAKMISTAFPMLTTKQVHAFGRGELELEIKE